MLELFCEVIGERAGEDRIATRAALLDDILSLNGKPSIHQMNLCAQRICERGDKPPEPEALLHEYQNRLDKVIVERSGKILRDVATPDEFVIYGARDFLQMLQKRGCVLIILSGTNESRVKEEADLLGLTRYFGRHIYGSTPDPAQSSKQSVIRRLLAEEKISGKHLLSFGDGPIEIQATKELGGLAVGVASDEQNNGSGKIHAVKRKQLLAAGADVVIPDYRDANALLECVFGK
jgi:phosphoglycolate phosphatase